MYMQKHSSKKSKSYNSYIAQCFMYSDFVYMYIEINLYIVRKFEAYVHMYLNKIFKNTCSLCFYSDPDEVYEYASLCLSF